MLRTASSLPHAGLLTLGSGPARFQAGPPACYRASWQLPGPGFHRQATTSLRTRRNTTALRHGVTSLFCWAHEKGSMIRDWRAQLLRSSVSVSMAAKAYRLLRSILATAVEEDK